MYVNLKMTINKYDNYLRSVGLVRTSSLHTALTKPLANRNKYGNILSPCCNPDSKKYKPNAMTAS